MNGETMYHYCNMEAFYGIINSNTIWLTDAYKTNDKYEISWILEVLKDTAYFEGDILEKIKESYDFWMKHFLRPHIACFSKKSDLLSQWRAYANDGKGLAIGFNGKYFDSISRIENKEFVIRDVIYDYDKQRALLHHLFCGPGNLASDVLEEVAVTSEAPDVDTNLNSHLDDDRRLLEFFKYGLLFKNHSFSEEREIRIIHGNEELVTESDNIRYRATQDNLISFIDIPINVKCNENPICEVIIGPKCKADISSIKNFLSISINGSYNIEVEKSSCSYI